MKMTPDTMQEAREILMPPKTKELIAKLNYMGRQYAAGQAARAGGQQKHYLEESADEIERLFARTIELGQEVADLRNVVQAACIGGMPSMAQAWEKHFPDHPITIAGVLAAPAFYLATHDEVTPTEGHEPRVLRHEHVESYTVAGWKVRPALVAVCPECEAAHGVLAAPAFYLATHDEVTPTEGHEPRVLRHEHVESYTVAGWKVRPALVAVCPECEAAHGVSVVSPASTEKGNSDGR